MSILLALRAWLPTIAHLLPYFAIAGVIWWVADMRATIALHRTELLSISEKLATETAARQRDVSALTTLSAGLTRASSARTRDQAILTETINASTATPVSAGLRDLLDGLRAADGGDVPATAVRTGGAAAR